MINGDVDESLFGSQQQSKTHSNRSNSASHTSNSSGKFSGPRQYFKSGISTLGGAAGRHNHTAVVSQKTFQNLQKLTGATDLNQLHAQTSILTSHDLYEVKENIRDNDVSYQQQTRNHSQQQSNKSDLAHAYRQKILAAENARVHSQELSDGERQMEEANRLLLQYAKTKLDENDDDVKSMNAMINYAKVVTIRDAQIAEKQRLLQEQLQEEKRLDDAMEIERVRAIQTIEERDRARRIEQRLGAQVINQQIAEREQQRLLEAEQREIESQQVLAAVRQQQAKEEAEKRAKVAAGKCIGLITTQVCCAALSAVQY